MDTTPDNKINAQEGALPYVSEGRTFASWQLRDTGSSFERYDPDATPSSPTQQRASFRDGKLELSWKASKGDVWHYNIYKIAEGEKTDYRDLLGQTKTASYTYIPQAKGTFYIVIQPESNTGLVGKPATIRITLK